MRTRVEIGKKFKRLTVIENGESRVYGVKTKTITATWPKQI